MTIRKSFRCVIVGANGDQLCTGIHIDVPSGLTRTQAIEYVTGVAAKEIGRYAASEALGLGPFDSATDWREIVT